MGWFLTLWNCLFLIVLKNKGDPECTENFKQGTSYSNSRKWNECSFVWQYMYCRILCHFAYRDTEFDSYLLILLSGKGCRLSDYVPCAYMHHTKQNQHSRFTDTWHGIALSWWTLISCVPCGWTLASNCNCVVQRTLLYVTIREPALELTIFRYCELFLKSFTVYFWPFSNIFLFYFLGFFGLNLRQQSVKGKFSMSVGDGTGLKIRERE